MGRPDTRRARHRHSIRPRQLQRERSRRATAHNGSYVNSVPIGALLIASCSLMPGSRHMSETLGIGSSGRPDGNTFVHMYLMHKEAVPHNFGLFQAQRRQDFGFVECWRGVSRA